jgi:hypothetical protein
MKRARLREASSTGVILALGVLLGAGGFLIVERMTRVNYTPPAFEQNQSIQQVQAAPERAQPFGTCDDARAAGAAPVYWGEPGYGEHLDRDGDGIACEPYRGR